MRGAPSVCQLWDAFETPNVSLLVLELLPGGDLFEQVVRRFGGGSPSVAEDAYTEDEVRELLRTALRGLAALHEMSIVHRDIKPENLVLSEAARSSSPTLGSRSGWRRASSAPMWWAPPAT